MISENLRLSLSLKSGVVAVAYIACNGGVCGHTKAAGQVMESALCLPLRSCAACNASHF